MPLTYKSILNILCLLTILLLTPSISRGDNDNSEHIDRLYRIAKSKGIWNDPEWRNLLHYERDTSQSSGYISQVDDRLFFNADNGKVNPESELKETLRFFFEEDDKGNTHAQCKFVARLNWLKHHLEIQDKHLPDVECSDYAKWRKLIRAERVTLVFPASHLNSPSSMFGHTLLRLDPAEDKNWSEWLSFAVNFGANIKESDDSIAYAFKGLTGGYPGIFIVTPYFKKIQEYNRIENRDIWEYELNLTTAETERMVQHLWELKEINFDYYFFDENCSYRLLELLEVARPGIELTDEFSLTAIPIDTVRAIENQGLIKSIEYRPSQSTILKHHLNQLNDEERSFVKKLSVDTRIASHSSFLQISKVKQKLITKSAYEYIRYQKTGKIRDEASSKQSYQLLKLLNTYPAKLSADPKINTPPDPRRSHESRRINITYGVHKDENFTETGYKFAFHDLIDNETGFLRGAQINMGNFRIRISSDNNLFLQRFDIIDIFSITPRTDFFNPLSWKILTGLERQFTDGKNNLVAHVTGGAGVSYNPTTNSLFYSLLMARLENNDALEKNIEPAIGFLTGTLFHFVTNTLKIEFSGEQFRNDIYRLRANYQHNFVLEINHSLVLKINREWQSTVDFSEASLSYQYYF